MRSTNINFKIGILFFVYNATCWLENVRRSTRMFRISSATASSSVLGRLRQLDGLVSLFSGISTLFRLLNAKAILLEE